MTTRPPIAAERVSARADVIRNHTIALDEHELVTIITDVCQVAPQHPPLAALSARRGAEPRRPPARDQGMRYLHEASTPVIHGGEARARARAPPPRALD